MTSDDNKTEWIDQYLDDRLEESDRIEFERRLQQDSAFRLEVEAQRAVRKSLQEWGDKELKAKFKQFHARMVREDTPSSKKVDISADDGKVRHLWSHSRVWTIAASVSLLLLAGMLWINRDAIFSGRKPAIAVKQTFHIPVDESGAGSMGYAGEQPPSDSIVVQIISDSQYAHHYRFKDTLQIFSRTISSGNKMILEYNDRLNTYTLVIDQARYPLEKGFHRIQALTKE